ncbi:MAG: amidinotransferase [Candidatus Omnitrophica bacterium CG11_big_fil_rev_8_21_14_0_20_63_9]|nr:MAG: amidinotransferase [Candidatus Omnitrophica bacterium CG11_big_fil_rev_8_21_14_0_20_63_9]
MTVAPRPSSPAPAFLMCRPTYYTIAYEINPWMSVKRQAHTARANAQWTRLYQTLTRQLGARVSLLPPTPGLPDLVFTANAGLMAQRVFIRSNFRYPQRQHEEPVIERYARERGWRLIRLAARYDFEGEGDALWLGETLIVGFRFRSDAPVHEELAHILARRVLPVELADRRFYHLDTCFCPLDRRTVLWFPKAFDRYGRRVIERFADHLIDVTEADAMRFVCNAIVVGQSIVMQQGASDALRRRLAGRGFRVYAVDLSEFLKAGGSAKCLVLTLNRSRAMSEA